MLKNTIKLLYVLTLTCLILALNACDYSYVLYRAKDISVSNIDLIFYNNPDAREKPTEPDAFNLNRLEIIYSLDPLQIEEFIEELSAIRTIGGRFDKTLFFHDGKGILITYEDGSFELITLTLIDDQHWYFVGEYGVDGSEIQSYDVPGISVILDKFDFLLEKYFPF